MQTPEELQNAFGFLYPDEVKELRRLAQALPAIPFVINIGAGVGTSAATFLEARADLALITVDIQEGVSPHGGLGNERRALAEMGLLEGRIYQQIAGDSKQVGKELHPAILFDLIFIDGDHSYEGCAGDINAWLPHLKPGGVLAIHDYGKNTHYLQVKGLPSDTELTPEMGAEAKAYPGVDQAVKDLLIGKYEQVSWVDTLISFRNVKL